MILIIQLDIINKSEILQDIDITKINKEENFYKDNKPIQSEY